MNTPNCLASTRGAMTCIKKTCITKTCITMTCITMMACLAAPGSLGAQASLDLDDGAKIDFGDDRWVRLGGRVHYDIAQFDDDVTLMEDNADFRRARLIADSRFYGWRFRADYDFGISPGMKNFFLQYRGWEKKRITIGNQVAPFSLQDATGNNDLTLPERSLAIALSPGMVSGAAYRAWGKNWTLTGGLFGEEMTDQDRRRIDGRSVIGRATITPIHKGDRVLHFGFAQEYRKVQDGKDVRIRTRPESRLTNRRIVDSRRLSGVGDVYTTGVEFLALIGRVRMQSEYIRMSLQGGEEATFHGGYAMLSTMLTGESYRYSRSRGAPRNVRPDGRFGALEASIRISGLDLQDGAVTGGRQSQLSAGLSWYLSEHFRTTLAYSLFRAEPNRNGIDENGSVTTLRFQLSI